MIKTKLNGSGNDISNVKSEKRHSQADDWAFQYSQAKAITMIGFTLCNI